MTVTRRNRAQQAMRTYPCERRIVGEPSILVRFSNRYGMP